MSSRKLKELEQELMGQDDNYSSSIKRKEDQKLLISNMLES